MTPRQVAVWIALLGGVLGGAALLDRIGFPAPQMILAIVVGAGLALAGRLPAPLPRQVNLGVQGLLGVLMGSYLQVSLLTSIGWGLLPVLAVTAATVIVSVGVAMVFARVAKVDLPTATLGLLAGGSAAVVAAADELGADARRVAFMQYLRVALIALSAPAIAALLDTEEGLSYRPAALGGSVTDPSLPYWMIVGRGDQLAGLSIAIMLCLIGIRVGKWLRLPNAALLGPMLIAAVVTALGLTHGYAPTHLFKDLLFVLIGFEVGTRFTRDVVKEMVRMLPAMTGAVLALSAVVAAMAFGLAALVDLEMSDLYLATTPGGINAVLATADKMNANLPLITSVQTIRLLVMMALLPLLISRIRRYETTRTPPAATPARSS
ncbi:AbrB family transcriptional regulator [Nocardia yunnanensis]|uniref:AbrB family transcriptional regulator n=1 Tax=Nocardia yunnanensis TaxID=2382165 RepID=A0A386Z4W4_9NOCA|nr:AbrB family transcriptional regulator [Nocardia yunnanensis]AYF72832.1 AbrB family transcriptional regulator [Nocardia yunnanensis]